MSNTVKLEVGDVVVDIESFEEDDINTMEVEVSLEGCYHFKGNIYEPIKEQDKWAEAIALRIADESSYEDKEVLKNALSIALKNNTKAVEMLKGTEVIEEDYFKTI